MIDIVDPRQSKEWGEFLTQINWQVKAIKGRQIFIRKLPFLPFSVIKIQRPKNPLPFIELDQLAKKHRALFINIDPHFQKFDQSILLQAGFKPSNMILSHSATVVVDLNKSQSTLFKSFSENAKRNIKKAKSNKLIIKKIYLKRLKDDQQFQKFYQLLKSLVKIRKFYIPEYLEFYKKMLSFKKSSILFFAYEKNNSEPIAAVWVAGYQHTAFYVQTGITKRGYETLANYLIVWEILKEVKRLGYYHFDFEGIFDSRFPKEREKWKGFSEFKKRFHGRVIEYPPSFIKIYSFPFKILYFISKFFPN